MTEDTVRDRLRVTVTRGVDRSYQFRIVADDDSGTAVGHLMSIGTRWLLDLYPTGDGVKAIRQYNGMPVYSQVVLEVADGSVRVAALDADSLRALARRGAAPKLGLAFLSGGDVLLTDSSARLGPGLAQYVARPGVLTGWQTLRRPSTGGLNESRGRHLTARRIGSGFGTGLAVGFTALHLNICFAEPCNWGFLQGGLAGYWLGSVVGTARVGTTRCSFANRLRRALVGSLPGVAVSVGVAKARPMVKDMEALAVTTVVGLAPIVSSSLFLRPCDRAS